jgi:hypothetical protein
MKELLPHSMRKASLSLAMFIELLSSSRCLHDVVCYRMDNKIAALLVNCNMGVYNNNLEDIDKTSPRNRLAVIP